MLQPWLERKAGAELAYEGTRNRSAAGIDVALRSEEVTGSIGVVVVISEVGFVGQIESLEDELEPLLLAKTEIFGEAHIQLEEGVASLRVVAGLAATACGDAGQSSCGVLAR